MTGGAHYNIYVHYNAFLVAGRQWPEHITISTYIIMHFWQGVDGGKSAL